MNLETFETQDLGQAAYCHYMGLKIVAKDRGNSKRVTLTFEGENASRIAAGYVNAEMVDPRKFAESYVRVRDYALDPGIKNQQQNKNFNRR